VRRSLFRFLALYLGSVAILLVIIGYLFFENNRVAMKSAMKFEMKYQARMLFSKIIMKAMEEKVFRDERFDLDKFLKNLKHCRFAVGYYHKDRKPIYTEIDEVKRFDKDFYVQDMQ
jgi:two-component system OmpR family sensor kinase